jgi:hypothetical protein
VTPPPQDPSADDTRLESADQLEQRQRPDGSLEEPDTIDDASGGPLSPDEIEQRQRLDGSVATGTLQSSGEPLDPDELEQRQEVADDDLDEERGDDDRFRGDDYGDEE